jgi:hypothetical protein
MKEVKDVSEPPKPSVSFYYGKKTVLLFKFKASDFKFASALL